MSRQTDAEGQDNADNFDNFYRQTVIPDENDNIDTLTRPDYPRMITDAINDFKYYTVEKFNENFLIDYDDQISLININIRGITKNYDNFINYLNSINHKFDIMVLTECHIQKNSMSNKKIDNRYPIEGYNMFYSESNIRFGGVVIYTKNNLKVTYVNELTISNEIYDSLFLKIDVSEISKTNKSLYVAGYYRHCRSSTSDIMKFIEKFDENLKNKHIKNNPMLIAGDFNICLLKSTYNNESQTFLNTILQNEFECHIFKPTRITYYKDSLQIKSMSIIDQIISNLLPYDCNAGNLFYPDSDHYANFVFVKDFLVSKVAKNENVYRRHFNNVNLENLNNEFENKDWTKLVYNEPNLDRATENVTNIIDDLLEKYVPLEKVPKRKIKYCQKPWIDKEMLKTIKRKNKMFTKYKNCPTEKNKIEFRKIRNKVTADLRNKKKKYFQKYFQKFKNDSKKIWDGINLALDQTKNKKSIPTEIVDTDGTILTEPKQKAKAFAKYFESVPAQTKSKIVPPHIHYLTFLHKCRAIHNYLVLYDTDHNEIYKNIMQLKNNTSPGPSPVPNRFLKLIASPLSYILINIFNRSMRGGYVPTSYKIGKQTPVYKTGGNSIKNFRPITVCCSLSKILEKIVRYRVNEYIMENNILNNSQFGFRTKHSTNHAMINLTEITLEALDKNLKVGGVFLDIAKAFDCVNHNILIRKLEFYGFRDTTLMWFDSYLKDRTQYVSINQHKSDKYNLKCGVPQGGTLAPILFILFMNDIIHSSQKFDFSIYADDTCLILAIEKKEYNETMKNELNKVVDWFASNDLLLNITKTDYLNFGPHYNNKYENEIEKHTGNKYKGEFVLHDLHCVAPLYHIMEHIVTPDGNIILEPPTVKYLGIQFDNKLNYKRQIDIIVCKVNRMVGTFWKCDHIAIETKKTIYHSLVESHINYGILIWASNFSKNLTENYQLDHIPKNLQSLNVALNKIIRAIFRVPKFDKQNNTYTSNGPLYKKLGVLRLHCLYYYHLALLCHDYFYEKNFPEKIASNFTLKEEVSNRNTRSNELDLYYTAPRLNSTYKKPTLAAAMLWNKLPLEIRKIKGKKAYKEKIKQYLNDNFQ